MPPEDALIRYINAYYADPFAFSTDAVDDLSSYAEQYNFPFYPNMDAEEEKTSSLGGQLFGGFLEGFLGPALPFDVVSDPTTESQQIARSIGGLIGFVPGIIGGPVKWAGAKAAGTGIKYISGIGKGLEVAGGVAKAVPSVPMWLGSKATKAGISKIGKASATADKFFKSGSNIADVVQSGMQLGTASAISEIWEGPDVALDALIHGAVAGGAFAGIGNFINMGKMLGHKNPKVRSGVERWWVDRTAKAVAGAAFQGGVLTPSDAPTGVQMYEYLLGAFFGGTHMTPAKRRGTHYIADYNNKNRSPLDFFGLKDTTEYSNLEKNSKSYVDDYYKRQTGALLESNLSEAGLGFRNTLDEIYKIHAESIGVKRKDLDDAEILKAQENFLEPILERKQDVRDAIELGEEIKTKDPEDLSKEAKEISSELTEAELKLIESGIYTPILNKIDEHRLRPKDIDIDPADPEVTGPITSVDQSEVRARPGLLEFLSDINKRIKDSGKKYTEAEIVKSAFDIYDRVVEKMKPSPKKQDEWLIREGKGKRKGLTTKIIEGVHPDTGEPLELALFFNKDGVLRSVRLRNPDNKLDGTNPGIGNFFGDPNNNYEGARKLRVEDDPNIVLERVDNIFTPKKPVSGTGFTIKYGPTGRKHGDAVVGASVNYDNKTITVDKKRTKEQFDEKAWAEPKVKGVKPLPKDVFKTYEEWERFVIEHELAHTRIKQGKNETKGDYENRINEEAFKVLSTDPKKPEVETGGLPDQLNKKILELDKRAKQIGFESSKLLNQNSIQAEELILKKGGTQEDITEAKDILKEYSDIGKQATDLSPSEATLLNKDSQDRWIYQRDLDKFGLDRELDFNNALEIYEFNKRMGNEDVIKSLLGWRIEGKESSSEAREKFKKEVDKIDKKIEKEEGQVPKEQKQIFSTGEKLSENPELAHEIIESLSEKYPNINRKVSEKLFDEHGNEIAGKALGAAVEWSRTKGAMDTPPHEYSHVYVNMFESSDIVQAGIRQFGKGKSVEEAKELLSEFLGKDYVKQIKDKSLQARVRAWVKEYWLAMKRYFNSNEWVNKYITEKDLISDAEQTELLSRRFYKGKPSGEAEPTTRGFAEESLQRFNSVPEEIRSNVVKTTLKSFGLIKDNETLILNDSFYRRLEKAGVKKAEIDLIKHMADSEKMHKVKADIFKHQMMQYLFPIKIVRSMKDTYPEVITEGGFHEEVDVPLPAGEKGIPSDFYERLSVRGGQNYGEYRFEVPFEVLRSHPEFATEKMLGWFRGDEMIPSGEYVYPSKIPPREFSAGVNDRLKIYFQRNEQTGKDIWVARDNVFGSLDPISYKKVLEYWEQSSLYKKRENLEAIDKGTFRVLELQSDLMQDARKGGLLIPEQKFIEYTTHEGVKIEAEPKYLPEKPPKSFWVEEMNVSIEYDAAAGKWLVGDEHHMDYISYKQVEQAWDRIKSRTPVDIGLSKDRLAYMKSLQKNWHDYLARSIHQWAAEEGYKKVKWPTGETAAKVEGHQVISDQLKMLKRQNKTWKEFLKKYKTSKEAILKDFKDLNKPTSSSFTLLEADRAGGPIKDILKGKEGRILDDIYGRDYVIKNSTFRLMPLGKLKESHGITKKLASNEITRTTMETEGNQWWRNYMKLRNVEPHGTGKKRAVDHYDFAKYVENNDWGLFIDTKPDLSRINYGRAKHGQLSFIKLSRKQAFDIYSSSKTVKENNSREIALRMLKRNDKEIQRYKTEGLEKLAPIESFYQNIMRRVLQKSRKKNLKLEKDEHGNFWFVTEITESDRLPIYQYQKLAKEPLKKEKINFDDFLKEWYESYPDLEPTSKTKRNLRNLFVRMSQNTPKTFLSYNPDTGRMTPMSSFNSVGERVQEMTPIKPHDEMYGYNSIELKEVFRDGGSHRPLGKYWSYDRAEGFYKYEDVMKPKDWQNVYTEQQKRGLYLWSPLKDKGRVIFRPYHPDVGKQTLKELLKNVGMDSRENLNWINYDRIKFFQKLEILNASDDVKDKFKKLHIGMVKSNILYESSAPFENSIDAVKRSTLLASTDYKLDAEFFKDISDTGKLNVIMVNDSEAAKRMPKPETYKIDGKERVYDSDIDGWMYVPNDMFKRIVEYFGMDPSTSRLKPTVAVKIGDQLFLIKGGIHPARVEYEALLHEPNTIIVATSAGKVHPGKEYLLYDKGGEVVFRDKAGKKVETPEAFEMNLEDLRINPNVVEDSNYRKVPDLKKQVHSFWSTLQVTEEAISEMKDIIDTNFVGDVKQNRYSKKILDNPKMTRPEDFDIKKIGDQEIVSILNSGRTDSWLVKDLYADMINETRYKGFEDELGLEPDLLNAKSYVNRLSEEMKATNFNPIAIRYLEANSENFNDLVLRYRRNKLIYPRWEWGGSAWAGGQDPVMKSRLVNKEIEKGTFKLGYNHRKMKVKGPHDNLEDLYKKWVAEKKNKKRKKQLGEELEFAVMRVPSPDVSGTRILRFDGFVGKRDYDALKSHDWGFYGRQEDYYYMDGMDVDADTVKFWQGFSEVMKTQIKKNSTNLEKNGNMKPNKDPDHNETYGSSPPGTTQHKYMHSKISQYLPEALMTAGETGRIGKQGMGTVVNAKTFLNQILADAVERKGKDKGKIYLPVYSNAGEQYAVITGTTNMKRIKDFKDGYFTHGYEATSRTADSNTFDKIKTASELASVLAEKGIKNLKVYKWNKRYNKITKEEIPFEFRLFRKTQYKELWEANSAMYGREFEGQKMTLERIQNITSRFADSSSDYQSTIWHMAQKFGSSENVNLDLLRYVDYDRWRRVFKAINISLEKARDNPEQADPNVLDFIARKELQIIPSYKRAKAVRADGETILPKGTEGEQILRFNDAMDGYSVIALDNIGKKVYRQMLAKGEGDQFKPFVQFMATEAQVLKDGYVNLKNRNRGLRKSRYGTVDAVEKGIAESKDKILQLANSYGVDAQLAEKYFDYFMLSSIWPQTMSKKAFRKGIKKSIKELKKIKDRTKSQDYELQSLKDYIKDLEKVYHKTTFHRYPLESKQIKKKNKTDFFNGFGVTFDIFRAGDWTKKTDTPAIKDKVITDLEPPRTPKEKDQNVKETLVKENKKIFNLFDIEVKKPKDPLPDEVNADLREIADIFNGFPSYAIESVSDMFTDMVAKRDGGGGYGINVATFRDVRDFRNYLRDIESARPKDDKLGKFDLFLFHSRQAEKQFTHDFSNPFKKSIPYYSSKGEWETRDINVPMGTMQFLQDSFGSIYKFENVLKETALVDRDTFYGYRKDILDMEDGTTHWYNLHRAGMAYYLRDAGTKPGDQAYYQEQWGKHTPLYDKLKGRIFKINIEGKTVDKTGAEVMDWIAKKHEERYDKIFRELVKGSVEETELPNGESIWTLVDVYDYNGKDSPNYWEFNKRSGMMKFNPLTGKANLDQLFNKLIKPIVSGDLHFIDVIKNHGGISNELIYRMQYEYALEEIIKNTPSIKNPKRFREKYRSRYEWREDAPGEGEYFQRRGSFIPIGRIENKYWSHMLHGETKQSRKEIEEYITKRRADLRSHLSTILNKRYRLGKGGIEDTKYEKDKRYELEPSDYDHIEAEVDGKYPNSQMIKSRIDALIERKVAELEYNFQVAMGRSVTDDNGATEIARNFVSLEKASIGDLEKTGFFNKPGSGRSRGDEPLPGFSLDFEVMERYEDQWISSFFKNTTALIAKKKIDEYRKLNPLNDPEVTAEWITLMKDYTRKTLGGPDLFNSEMLGLHPHEIKKLKKKLKGLQRALKIPRYSDQEEEIRDEINEISNKLREDKKYSKFKSGLIWHVSDEKGVEYLEYISNKLWGRRKGRPSLPFYGELPQDPVARKRVLGRILHRIGSAEAKYSLISLLSHPKTYLGNRIGGSHNTISQVGLRHFIDARNTGKMLSTVFRGATLRDGTVMTSKEHLDRFAEEQGAYESFYVTEASISPGLKTKSGKALLNDFLAAIRKDPDLADTTLYEIGKKHGFGKAAVDSAAWFMRKSERKLRTESFFAHFLNSHEILKTMNPDLKYNDPYLINFAIKGVEATQFLYHSAFRTNYSNTALGKMMTRFHPFAWNSIRFRRLAYKRAKRYGFREGTQDFERFRRLITMDIMAMALASIFPSSLFDSALPPPMSYLQDVSDWLFGDERARDRAFFSSWPHPWLAPLQIATPPSARILLTPVNAMVNGNWDRFSDYYLWTFFPFGRLGRSIKRTIEVPEMWLESMVGIPIHDLGRKMDAMGQETA